MKKECAKGFHSETEFVVKKKDGIVLSVDNSYTYHPKTDFKGREIIWFNDSNLIKERKVEEKND